jgi:3,4-dihydroxy 2-butanone 4-phosphate synthase/GTP cyclohydrolase II
MIHSIEEAIADLKKGRPVIVVDDENRENEGDLIALSDRITPEVINFMITHAKGLVCVPLEKKHAEKLQLRLMVENTSDPYETAFTVSIDHVETDTGISAYDRALTIQKMLDQGTEPNEFKRPGHIFPLIAKDGGVLTRPGHTEAAVDLAKLSGSFPSGVICEIIKPDGTMARLPDLERYAEQFDLKLITIEDLIAYRKKNEDFDPINKNKHVII